MNSAFLNAFHQVEKFAKDPIFEENNKSISVKAPSSNTKQNVSKGPTQNHSLQSKPQISTTKTTITDQKPNGQPSYFNMEEEKAPSLKKSQSFNFMSRDDPLRISTIAGVKTDNVDFYNQIQSALKAKKELFDDTSFPPAPKSISQDPDKVQIAQQVVWVRIPEIYTNRDIVVCSDQVGPNDIIQGQLGNCFFLSALSALADQKEYIQRLFHSRGVSSTGCYSIWFCDSGEWKNILIDDYIPCYLTDTGYCPKFSKSFGNDVWVLLLEKAYAKLYGNYFRTSTGYQGEALSALTGAPIKYFTPKNNGMSQLDQLWLFILGSLENKFVLTVSSRKETEVVNNSEMGLISTHAYAILEAKEITLPGKPKVRLIKMRNPWGNKEWTGDWSDTSARWTPELKAQLKYEPKVLDGVFWISLSDFNKHFFQPCVCKVHSNFGYSFLKLGENKKQNLFISKMTVKSPGFAYLSVQQRRRKHFQNNSNYDYSYLRFILAKTDERGQILSIIHGKYKNHQSIYIKKNLESGNYLVIIEVDWLQSIYNQVVLSAYSAVEIEFQEEPLTKYNVPALYENIIKTYIFTSGDPKVEGSKLKISGAEREAWKYPFPARFGLGALLLVNKEASDLHYKIQIDTFINMEIFVPKSQPQASLVSIIVPPGKEGILILKAKVLKGGDNNYGYKCRESYAIASNTSNPLNALKAGPPQQISKTPAKPAAKTSGNQRAASQNPKPALGVISKAPLTQLTKELNMLGQGSPIQVPAMTQTNKGVKPKVPNKK